MERFFYIQKVIVVDISKRDDGVVRDESGGSVPEWGYDESRLLLRVLKKAPFREEVNQLCAPAASDDVKHDEMTMMMMMMKIQVSREEKMTDREKRR